MFSKEKKARAHGAGKAPGRADKANGSALSFIGPEVVISGDIATEARLHVDGRIEGDVRCTTLSQGEAGTIAGNIVAEEARLAGLVDGTVTARNLILGPTARVTGDVAYETLSIESGARIGRRRRAAETGRRRRLISEPSRPPSVRK